MGLLDTFVGLLVFLVGVVALYACAIYDAIAVRLKTENVEPKPYNRWYVYLVIVLAIGFVVGPVVRSALPIRAYKIPSGSKWPTVKMGDHVYVRLDAYKDHRPRRGDIIAYHYPLEPDREFLHRVIGLPGETIAIKDRQVYIDGKALNEPYVFFMLDKSERAKSFQPGRDDLHETILSGEDYFTLGDNRDNAHDSRFWGTLPADLIVGQALYVYWSKSWLQIGTALR